MDADVALHRFAQEPFVIERPAGSGRLADDATTLLAKVGMRLDFTSRGQVDAAHVDLVREVLPPGIAVLDRTTGSLVPARSSGPVTHVVAGPADGEDAAAPDPTRAMAYRTLAMASHALLGNDRRLAAAFASLLSLKAGAGTSDLEWAARRTSSWEAAGPGRGSASTATTLAALRGPLVTRLAAFRKSDRTGLESLSRTIAEQSRPSAAAAGSLELARRDAAFADASLALGVGTAFPAALDAAREASLGVPVPSFRETVGLPDETRPRFAARLAAGAIAGPSWLPPSEFPARTLRAVRSVHPDLLRVVCRAAEICPIAFDVVPGTGATRGEGPQAPKDADRFRTGIGRLVIGDALDLAPVDADGDVDFGDVDGFAAIRDAMEAAAEELDVPIQWGVNWGRLSDRPPSSLVRFAYPVPGEAGKAEELQVAFR